MATPLYSGALAARSYSADIVVTPGVWLGVNVDGPFKVLAQNEGGGVDKWSTIWVSDKDAGRPIQSPSDKIRIGALDVAINVEVFDASMTVQLSAGAAPLAVAGRISSQAVAFSLPAVAVAYAVDDILRPVGSLIRFVDFFREAGGSGYIVAAGFSTNKRGLAFAPRLHLFNSSSPDLPADNAAYYEKYADASKRLRYFDLPALATATDANADMSRAIATDLRIPVVAAPGSRDLWLAVQVLSAGFTPDANQSVTVSLTLDNN